MERILPSIDRALRGALAGITEDDIGKMHVDAAPAGNRTFHTKNFKPPARS
jgi:hypothetical protein